jgi:hypothetical protein
MSDTSSNSAEPPGHWKLQDAKARFRENVENDAITRNLTQVKPTEQEYWEATFMQIRCDEIDYIGITDPGRCAIGDDMNRFTTQPGDCGKFVDIAVTPLMTLREIKQERPVEELEQVTFE